MKAIMKQYHTLKKFEKKQQMIDHELRKVQDFGFKRSLDIKNLIRQSFSPTCLSPKGSAANVNF